MKKIASAVLFVSLVASANANKFTEGVANNRGKIATGLVSTALVGGALYYEIKQNDSKVLKAARKLIKENPKAAAGILVAVTGTSLLTADLTLNDNSYVKATGRGIKNGTVATGRSIKSGAVATYNGVKSAPGKVVDGVKHLNPAKLLNRKSKSVKEIKNVAKKVAATAVNEISEEFSEESSEN